MTEKEQLNEYFRLTIEKLPIAPDKIKEILAFILKVLLKD